jgi:hypothetical protein
MPRKKTDKPLPLPWDPATDKAFIDSKTKALSRHAVYGIRAVFFRPIADSHHKMAGYLNLHDSEALIQLCSKDRDGKGPLSEMDKHWKTSFGYATASGRETDGVKWETQEILAFVFQWREPQAVVSQDSRSAEILNNSLPLDPTRWPYQQRSRGVLGLVICLKQIVQHYRKEIPLFAGGAGYQDAQQIVAGLHAEDWYRAFQFFRYYKTRFSKFAASKETTDADGKSRAQQAVRAGLMYYLTDEDISNKVDESAKTMAEVVGMADAWAQLGADEDTDEDFPFDDSPEFIVKGLAALEASFVDRARNPEQIARGKRLAQDSVSISSTKHLPVEPFEGAISSTKYLSKNIWEMFRRRNRRLAGDSC